MLANGIVHDFRNPMSSLRLDAQLLEKETAKGAAGRTERVAELSCRMRTTLDRMDKVFQEFLYVSRPASDEVERFDLVACVRDCATMLAARYERKRLQFELQPPPAPVLVSGRRSAVQRALLNVMTNAEQFSPENGVVTVRVGERSGRGVVEVGDQGPGIPQAQRSRVFDLFYSSRPEGTGLGLFLAKTALEGQGGSIRIEDAPGGGALVLIELPLAERGSEPKGANVAS
jgi:signal transduction histidine kinase